MRFPRSMPVQTPIQIRVPMVVLAALLPMPLPSANATVSNSQVEATATQTVYVTRTGKKYHRAGCQYLRKSAILMDAKKAAAYFTPCSRCW